MDFTKDFYKIPKKPKEIKTTRPIAFRQTEGSHPLEEAHYWPPVIRLTPRLKPAIINRKTDYFRSAWSDKASKKKSTPK